VEGIPNEIFSKMYPEELISQNENRKKRASGFVEFCQLLGWLQLFFLSFFAGEGINSAYDRFFLLHCLV
jgi:hypothetical protein